MFYPHYDPYFQGRGMPYPPGVPPSELKNKMTKITREKQIKQKMEDGGSASP
jgi:hypothetical protein